MSEAGTFAADWLSLREPADHTARSETLARHLAHHLRERGPLRIVDLGAGHGSNLRWLAPRLAGRQHWLLVDRDPALLEIARERCADDPPAAGLALEIRQTDLAGGDLGRLVDCDLVTASALFDLVSEAWLVHLARSCQAHRCAALLALSVTGEWCFLDTNLCKIPDDEDDFVRERFNRHQCRDKGLGAALGPAAAEALPRVFGACGFDVETRHSDWALAASEALTRRLGPPLLQGWRDAAIEQAPEAATRIRRWHDRRLGELVAGDLGLRVGHVDVLALPNP